MGQVDRSSKKDYNNKVYVGGLVDALSSVTESDIRQVIKFVTYLNFSGSRPSVISITSSCPRTQ